MHDKQCDRLHPASSWEAFFNTSSGQKKYQLDLTVCKCSFKMLFGLLVLWGFSTATSVKRITVISRILCFDVKYHRKNGKIAIQ